MRIVSEDRDGILVLTVEDIPSGQLDMSNIKEFERHLPDLSPVTHLALDLRHIAYIDSAAIGTLVDILNTLRNRGGSVTLLNLHEKVRTILELANLAKFFRLGTSTDNLSESPS